MNSEESAACQLEAGQGAARQLIGVEDAGLEDTPVAVAVEGGSGAVGHHVGAVAVHDIAGASDAPVARVAIDFLKGKLAGFAQIGGHARSGIPCHEVFEIFAL